MISIPEICTSAGGSQHWSAQATSAGFDYTSSFKSSWQAGHAAQHMCDIEGADSGLMHSSGCMMFREDVQPLDSKLLARLHMQASPNSPGFGALSEFATAEDSASLSEQTITSASTAPRPTLSSSTSLPHLSSMLSNQHQQLQSTWLAQVPLITGAIASSSVASGSQQQSQGPFLWTSNSDVSGYVQQPKVMHRSSSATDFSHTLERSVRRGIPTYQRSSTAKSWDSRTRGGGMTLELASLTEDDMVSASHMRFSSSHRRRSSESSGSGCTIDSKQRAGAGLMEGRIRGGKPTSVFSAEQASGVSDKQILGASWSPMLRTMSMPSTRETLCLEVLPVTFSQNMGHRPSPLGTRSCSMDRSQAGMAISLNSANLRHLDRSLSASRSVNHSSLTALALSPSFASLAASTSQPRMFRVRPSATDLSALMPPGIGRSNFIRSSHSLLPNGRTMSDSLLPLGHAMSQSLDDALFSGGSSQTSLYSFPNNQMSPGGSYTLGELARDLEQQARRGSGGDPDRGCYSLGELGREFERTVLDGRGSGNSTRAASLSLCEELLPSLSMSPATGRRAAGEERNRRHAHFQLEKPLPGTTVTAAGPAGGNSISPVTIEPECQERSAGAEQI